MATATCGRLCHLENLINVLMCCKNSVKRKWLIHRKFPACVLWNYWCWQRPLGPSAPGNGHWTERSYLYREWHIIQKLSETLLASLGPPLAGASVHWQPVSSLQSAPCSTVCYSGAWTCTYCTVYQCGERQLHKRDCVLSAAPGSHRECIVMDCLLLLSFHFSFFLVHSASPSNKRTLVSLFAFTLA